MVRKAAAPKSRGQRARAFLKSERAAALLMLAAAGVLALVAVTEPRNRIVAVLFGLAALGIAVETWKHGIPGWLYTVANLRTGGSQRPKNRHGRR